MLSYRSGSQHIGSAGPPKAKLYLLSLPIPSNVVGIKFTIISRDQGFCDDPNGGQWSWFEAGILRHQQNGNDQIRVSTSTYSSVHDFSPEAQRQGWEFVSIGNEPSVVLARNPIRSQTWTTHELHWNRGSGEADARQTNFLNALRQGDRIGVWARAQYPGWSNYVSSVRIEALLEAGVNFHESRRFLMSPLTGATTDETASTLLSEMEGFSFLVQNSNMTESFRLDAEVQHIPREMDNGNLPAFANTLECPADNPEKPLRPFFFYHLFKAAASMRCLAQALQETEAWLSMAPDGQPSVFGATFFLEMMLNDMMTPADSPNPIQTAIQRRELWPYISTEATEKALRTMPPNFEHRVRFLRNLGNLYGSHYERTRKLEDLDQAVKLTDQALESALRATPSNHQSRSGLMIDLANWLEHRFQRKGDMGDLDRAIELEKGAKNIGIPASLKSRHLGKIGLFRFLRYQRFNDEDDLQQAIRDLESAIAQTSPDDPNRSDRLTHFSIALAYRFEKNEEIEDLKRAIDVLKEVYNTSTPDDPRQPGRMSSLGEFLRTLYNKTGSLEYLDEAIDWGNFALGLLNEDSPERASWLNNLGNSLDKRYEVTEKESDLKSATTAYTEAYECVGADTLMRVHMGFRAAVHLALQKLWKEATTSLENALELLPTVSPRSLKHPDRQAILERFGGMATMAAATALNAGMGAYKALQLLELGRGVIASLLLETRSDVSKLERRHPNVAKEFKSLQEDLDSPFKQNQRFDPLVYAPSWQSQTKQREEREEAFKSMVRKIRSLSDFDDFLLPPTEKDIVTAAGNDNLVVINVNEYRCDAFLIGGGTIRVLPLHNLDAKILLTKIQNLWPEETTASPSSFYLMHVLEWLWDTVTFPILEALGLDKPNSDSSWPHVWWIPTGGLSYLPLHAAGYYDNKGTEKTVLDRVMSSYSPSIKVLRHGRQQAIRRPESLSFRPDALLVAMGEELGQYPALRFADPEVSQIESICNSIGCEVPKITLKTREEVLKHLRKKCVIFHFAGHGDSQSSDPSESRLILDDWEKTPLTVADLRDQRLHEAPPFLGYLSACSTGFNSSSKLVDEVIHLVSACQLAGFRHVVGTLWPVSDRCCITVAKCLYETLDKEGMTDQAVCRGLHKAVRELRNDLARPGEERNAVPVDKKGVPLRSSGGVEFWAPYIHFGV